jgi:hypothetical protein
MKKYGLFNKLHNKLLTHPRVGLWFSFDIKEAEDMLKSCKEYLVASSLGYLQDNFVIADVETKEIVSQEA